MFTTFRRKPRQLLCRPVWRSWRRGAVTVEMAVVAPVFVAVVVGMVETSHLFDLHSQLSLAARHGARLAAMDRTGLLQNGQSTNAKITSDIQNLLTANGLPGDEAAVYIVDAIDHTTPFDLDAAANRLRLFELRVELPYDRRIGAEPGRFNMVGKVVFRNASGSLIQ